MLFRIIPSKQKKNARLQSIVPSKSVCHSLKPNSFKEQQLISGINVSQSIKLKIIQARQFRFQTFCMEKCVVHVFKEFMSQEVTNLIVCQSILYSNFLSTKRN
jgi:hypothetical protein